MVSQPDSPQLVAERQWRWLAEASDGWTRDGLVTADQRERIMARYRVDHGVAERRGRVILTTLAVLATSIAVFLVLGYNWEALGRSTKVAILFGSVVTAFGASALSYSRGRQTGGELLAFAGTLLYGNAIWLLAEVFHISSHYPDGLLWWAIGTLVAGGLVRSRLVAIEAAALVVLWVIAETAWYAQPNYLFLAIGGASFALAYFTRSAWSLALTSLATVLWIVTSAGVALDAGRLAVGLGLLAGAAFHGTGRLHAPAARFARVWRGVGLIVLAFFLGPFLVHDLHEPLTTLHVDVVWPVLAMAAGLLGIVAVTWVKAPTADEDSVVRGIALAAAAWMTWVAASAGLTPPVAIGWAFTILASAVTMALGVALIRTGMRDDRGWLFAAGVGYVLLFLLVRWADLLDNMLWSALFMLVSAGVLFWIARLWSTRHKEAS